MTLTIIGDRAGARRPLTRGWPLPLGCAMLPQNRSGGGIMTEPAKNGDRVRVHYTGRLEGGQVFDTSREGEPLEFTVGADNIIQGRSEERRVGKECRSRWSA